MKRGVNVNRLCGFLYLFIRLSGQIRNRPGQLQDTMIGPGAQLHLLHRRLEQVGAGLVQLAELADFRRSHPTRGGYALSELVCSLASLNRSRWAISARSSRLSTGGIQMAGMRLAASSRAKTKVFHRSVLTSEAAISLTP